MSVVDSLLSTVEGAEERGLDMSQTGASGSRLYPEGVAFVRPVAYIETGKHPKTYNGKETGSGLKTYLGFALFDCNPSVKAGADNSFMRDDGGPGFLWYNRFGTVESNASKANVKALFDQMNYAGDAKRFFQFLGRGFVADIGIKQPKKADGNPYNIIKSIRAPIDPMSNLPYPIPELPADYPVKLFLWGDPNMACWESIFVDGVWENDDGTVKSRNSYQEECLAALDFETSALKEMLENAGIEYTAAADEPKEPTQPVSPVQATTDTGSTPTPEPMPVAAVPASPQVPEVPAVPTPPPVPSVPQ